ncbi:hypothetical protein [Dongia sp.]|uniref:hypothetical protein n=1 Tax=Dongia sp. TaxID=1977262 RepID=UPI0035B42995
MNDRLDITLYRAKRIGLFFVKCVAYPIGSIVGIYDISDFTRGTADNEERADLRALSASPAFIRQLGREPEIAAWLHICAYPVNRKYIDLSKLAPSVRIWTMVLTDAERKKLIEAGMELAMQHAKGQVKIDGVRQPREFRHRPMNEKAPLIIDHRRVLDDCYRGPRPSAEPSADLSADLVPCSHQPYL